MIDNLLNRTPVVVIVVDETGHATMHPLPQVQGGPLRSMLGLPAWDSEGADVDEMLRVTGEVAQRRREAGRSG